MALVGSPTKMKQIEKPTPADLFAGSTCLFCQTPLKRTFVDLGMSPLCESYLPKEKLNEMEPFYPLHARVCERCFLVQVDEFVSPEHIFSEYAYFSSFADSWVAHAKRYVDMIVPRLSLNQQSFAVELASNDGYLLKHFLPHGVPMLGIEPAANVAVSAEKVGVPTLVKFFGVTTARELERDGKSADLIIGNNVLAQVPDINDFVAGMRILLKPGGVITMEFPHLLRLMQENQFDTIYHEHFSYFSLLSVETIFAAHDLVLFDVDEIPTHGGSLRIYARHELNHTLPITERILKVRADEAKAELNKLTSYDRFSSQVMATKRRILSFLIDAKNNGKTVAGYGAPGKGNTLLNYCGIRNDLISFTVDRNPYKQGKFLPGTHIPILTPDAIREARPDYLFILPWNFKDEIMVQNSFIREWGGKFVIPIPELTVIS